jgi:FAD/FMN-containing dehydrogenase
MWAWCNPDVINRRAFLLRSATAALASGAGFGLLSTLGCGDTAGIAPAPSALPWGSLARRLSGHVVLPSDAAFAPLARPNNLRYASRVPAGIAMCTNAEDVSASILWARENGVPLVARTGGHSYAGYSTTTGLMIDLGLMNSFAFDSGTGIATFGGGARNRDVYSECRKANVAITHGRCLSVGVAGLTLGGGVGFNMRAYGLTCDRLTSTEIVTADGSLHAPNASSEYDDLLWACRGAGGGNFGINTSLSFHTFPVNRVTAYDLRWNRDQERIFQTLTTVLEAAPATLGCKVSAGITSPMNGGSGDIEVRLLGQFYDSVADLLELLQPVYAIAKPTRTVFLENLPYWDAQDKLSESGAPEFFEERSRFFNDAIDADAVALVFASLRKWPGNVATTSFKLFETGERVNAVAPSATAFVHRSSRWLGSIAVVWDASTSSDILQRNLEWQAEFYEAIVPFAKGGAYQNFIDPSLRDWKAAYYGTNLPRLEALKRRVDPTHVFNFPEAIP